MIVLLTGATGAIGRPTVRKLQDAGHRVRAVARDDIKARRLVAQGAEAARVDLFDPEAVAGAVEGVDAVVHLATNVPPMSKMAFPGAWRTHNRLRTEATQGLLDAARTHGVGLFVKESITFTYPDRGDAWIDETVALDESIKMLRPTIEGERLVARFGADGGRGVVLRFGLFYGPDNRATDETLSLAKMRIAPIPGARDGYVSSIHVEDAAAAVVAALDVPAGVYNVVDDEPLTRREYADAFAAAFDLPRLHVAPGAPMRVVGGSGARALISSQRVSNRRMRDATGWAPAYPSVREGWVAIAAARQANTKEGVDDA
ncbi:MAG: NAD(P)-dependent oxidoreductase [Acidimicrobiia bacterium]